RGRRRAGSGPRPGRLRRRPAPRRVGPRRRAARAGERGRGSSRVSDSRSYPGPLDVESGLPYSKGLLARALMATGVSAVRAYELALRVEADLTVSGARTVDLDRLEELA